MARLKNVGAGDTVRMGLVHVVFASDKRRTWFRCGALIDSAIFESDDVGVAPTCIACVMWVEDGE